MSLVLTPGSFFVCSHNRHYHHHHHHHHTTQHDPFSSFSLFVHRFPLASLALCCGHRSGFVLSYPVRRDYLVCLVCLSSLSYFLSVSLSSISPASGSRIICVLYRHAMHCTPRIYQSTPMALFPPPLPSPSSSSFGSHSFCPLVRLPFAHTLQYPHFITVQNYL